MTMQKSLVQMGIIVALAMGLILFAGSMLGFEAHAQDTSAACAGVEITGGSCDPNSGRTELSGIITAVVDILSILVGALSVIFIIIGGFRYITSSGDSQKTAGAKNTILYAIVGLLVVVFAQVIVNFAINETTA